MRLLRPSVAIFLGLALLTNARGDGWAQCSAHEAAGGPGMPAMESGVTAHGGANHTDALSCCEPTSDNAPPCAPATCASMVTCSGTVAAAPVVDESARAWRWAEDARLRVAAPHSHRESPATPPPRDPAIA